MRCAPTFIELMRMLICVCRYMGTPASSPLGYHNGSVLTHAVNIRGKLLLIHGLIDENVHAKHSFRLITKLYQDNIPFQFLPLPGERHLPRYNTYATHVGTCAHPYISFHCKNGIYIYRPAQLAAICIHFVSILCRGAAEKAYMERTIQQFFKTNVFDSASKK
jgi:hypothetical protein